MKPIKTTELTPEMMKQFIEDVEAIMFICNLHDPDPSIDKSHANYEQSIFRRTNETLKTLKRVYLNVFI